MSEPKELKYLWVLSDYSFPVMNRYVLTEKGVSLAGVAHVWMRGSRTMIRPCTGKTFFLDEAEARSAMEKRYRYRIADAEARIRNSNEDLDKLLKASSLSDIAHVTPHEARAERPLKL